VFYDKALNLDSKNIDAMVNKGSALHALGFLPNAILCYDEALKIDKQCAMAYAYKGLSLGEIGDIDAALDNFKKALLIDKDYDVAKISKEVAQDLLKVIRNEKIKAKKL
jgi:tetratricopeptide (TPR) repeat protein